MNASFSPCHFTKALLRTPSTRCVDGLRAVDRGAPDYQIFLSQHAAYAGALTDAGLIVDVLPPLDEYPDAVFIEDDALCLPDLAIRLCPGAESRRGEVAHLTGELQSRFSHVASVKAPAFVEGGDILVLAKEILIGLSHRTTEAGAMAIREIAASEARPVRIVETPDDVLHFKTDCAVLDKNTVLSTKRLAKSGAFESYRILTVPDGEEDAANAIRVNDRVLLASGYPETAKMLRDHGYNVVEIDISEAAKLDGGLSCMSLRFT